MSILSLEQLRDLGFARVGRNPRVSDRASFYGAERISIDDDVRIDDFCVISAGADGIEIASNVHIAVYSSLIGAARISLGDFCNISSRVGIFSSSDDFSGTAMTNPTLPAAYTNVTHAPVTLGRHVIVGTGSTVLPGSHLEDGVAVGAMSLVKGHCREFGVYAGIPARRVKERKRDLLAVELDFVARKRNESKA